MKSADGNQLIVLLAYSTMRDNSVNGVALGRLYEAYNSCTADMVQEVHAYLRACGYEKMSSKTISLASIVLQYFREEDVQTEETIFVCPVCGGPVRASEVEATEFVHCKCQTCSYSATVKSDSERLFATVADIARYELTKTSKKYPALVAWGKKEASLWDMA